MVADLPLAQLARLVRLVTPDQVLAGLRDAGVVIEPPSGEWRPLADGREYTHLSAERLLVDGVASSMVVEVSRPADDEEPRWVDNLILGPAGGDDHDHWLGSIRDALAREYEAQDGLDGGAASFGDGLTAEFLLLPAGPFDGPGLIVSRANPPPRRP